MKDTIGGMILTIGFFIFVLILILGSIDGALSMIGQMVMLALRMLGLG